MFKYINMYLHMNINIFEYIYIQSRGGYGGEERVC